MNINTRLGETKQASLLSSQTSSIQRNLFLTLLQKELLKNTQSILSANRKDLKNYDLQDSRHDRLLLNEKRIQAMADSVEKIKKLPDPLGRVLEKRTLPNRLQLTKTSVPLGVVCVIYESRPNVTIDLTALAVKSGNALVLKGGKESWLTNQVLTRCVHTALRQAQFPTGLVYLLPPDRETLHFILQQDRLIDVVIPRGSNALIDFVRKNSSIPVIETGAGVVHTYVDETANLSMAVDIVINEKIQRPSVCNALDFLLVHKKVSSKLFQLLSQNPRFRKVELHADPASHAILKARYPKDKLRKITNTDLGQEYLRLTMGVKVVGSFDQALAHIQQYSSRHSECIVTENKSNAQKFLQHVDAACVYWNASTRFTDGEEFGMGGEVGVSTQKLHARGPMGLPELTSYKWLIEGKGQIRP